MQHSKKFIEIIRCKNKIGVHHSLRKELRKRNFGNEKNFEKGQFHVGIFAKSRREIVVKECVVNESEGCAVINVKRMKCFDELIKRIDEFCFDEFAQKIVQCRQHRNTHMTVYRREGGRRNI